VGLLLYVTYNVDFDVLLAVHLSVFISVFNHLDAQNLFHNKFYFMPLHVSSKCAHHQEVQIALHSSGIIKPIGVMIPEAVYTILTS